MGLPKGYFDAKYSIDNLASWLSIIPEENFGKDGERSAWPKCYFYDLILVTAFCFLAAVCAIYQGTYDYLQTLSVRFQLVASCILLGILTFVLGM